MSTKCSGCTCGPFSKLMCSLGRRLGVNDCEGPSAKSDGCCSRPAAANSKTEKPEAPKPIKRALGVIDAENDFGSETHCQRSGLVSFGASELKANPELVGSPRAQLPVPGGEEIAPLVARLLSSTVYFKRFASKDWHPAKMFNFASVNPQAKPYADTVLDEDGQPATVYPDHCLANTWGSEFLPGIDGKKFDKIFFKGTSLYKDHYSVVAGNPNCVPWLKAQGITHIDLCGLVFRICVGMSAIDLAKAGFKVRVIKDATRDLDIPFFQKVIDEMVALGIEFVTVEDVLAGK